MDRIALGMWMVLVVVAVGCSGDDEPGGTDGGGGLDSGTAEDAGSGVDSGGGDVDGGPGTDAGPRTDAGPGTDAGTGADGGANTDAGSSGSDAGAACIPAGDEDCAVEGAAPCCEGSMCCAGVPLPTNGRCLAVSSCPISDRNVKHGFAAVDPEAVLETLAAVPVSTWSYDFEEGNVRHIGPMAQDFHAAFGLGADDRVIPVIDSAGVSFAAIQALHARTERLSRENESLRRDNEQLRDHLEALDARLEALEQPRRDQRLAR